jgi:hypothetical protein
MNSHGPEARAHGSEPSVEEKDEFLKALERISKCVKTK